LPDITSTRREELERSPAATGRTKEKENEEADGGGNEVKDAEARQERARTAWLTIYGEKGEGEAGIRVPQFALADNYIKR
jgi:hypothetical protein